MNNWTEPLPKHTKVDYYESYAKIVLEEFYPKEFIDLRIVDKPDLQSKDGTHGIEVTIAIDSNQMKADNIYSDISYGRIRNKDNSIKEIEKCGCKLEDGILRGKVGTDSFDLILKAFEDKLDKLKGNQYKYFKSTYLFVFSNIYADKKMIFDGYYGYERKAD